jgi:hypothetical protein
MPISCVYFIPLLVIEEGCYIFKSFMNGASDIGRVGTCSRPNPNTQVVSPDLCQAFPCQDVAYVDGANCT